MKKVRSQRRTVCILLGISTGMSFEVASIRRDEKDVDCWQQGNRGPWTSAGIESLSIIDRLRLRNGISKLLSLVQALAMKLDSAPLRKSETVRWL